MRTDPIKSQSPFQEKTFEDRTALLFFTIADYEMIRKFAKGSKRYPAEKTD